MMADIMTWVGGMLGVAVLSVMAVGPMALDVHDTRRRHSTPPPETPTR